MEKYFKRSVFWKFREVNGFDSKEVLKAINDSPDAAPELTNLVKNTVDASGIKEWDNPKAILRAYQYAKEGLYHAIGQSTAKNLKNEDYLNPMQRAQLAALNPTPPTPSEVWEQVGDKVDTSKSPEVQKYNSDIEYLKVLQSQRI